MKIKTTQTTVTGIFAVLAAALFLVVVITPSWVGAAPRSGAGEFRSGKPLMRQHPPALGIWKNQQVIAQLKITEAQVQQLRDADFSSREKRLALKTRLDQLRLQLDKAFAQKTPDQKAIRQLAEKVADVKGKMFVQKIEERLDLGAILTPEQINKLEPGTRHKHPRKGHAGGMAHSAQR